MTIPYAFCYLVAVFFILLLINFVLRLSNGSVYTSSNVPMGDQFSLNKQEESGENYIMRSLMICTPHPILCG